VGVLRRAAVALGVASLVATALRVALRGSRPTPESPSGAWRELSGPDLR